MESVPAEPAAVRSRRPNASEFVFARLRYDSGDWDYNPKVAANVLNSLVEYTTIPVYPEEVVITADSEDLLAFPVPLHDRPQAGPVQRGRARPAAARSSSRAACSSPTTATTTSTASTRRASSRRCGRVFPGAAHAGQAAAAAPDLSLLLPVPRRPADDLARAQRLGGRHRPRLPARRRAPRPRSACSTRTRITAASGTTTGATSASSARTTPSSR